MNKRKSLFFIGGAAFVGLAGAYFAYKNIATSENTAYEFTANKYGAFLAANHAILNHDFENADKYASQLEDTDIEVVSNVLLLSEFLNGKLPEGAKDLESADTGTEQFVYDLYLAKNNKWEELYAKHKNDETAIISPIRIWSGVATNYITKTLQFIDSLKTNESWKNFVRGQIYAELNRPEKAAAFFDKVETSFLNINDFLYLTAFYKHFDMGDKADELFVQFTSNPGGMYILNSTFEPKWEDYTGYQNAMAFSLTQNISHSQLMMYTDLSLMMLRFAEILQESEDKNAINYYLGQYFLNNDSGYEKYLNNIEPESLFYYFAQMKIAEKSGNIKDLKRIVENNPLFLPAVSSIVAKYTGQGDKSKALKTIDKSLKMPNLTEKGRSFLFKLRSDVNIAFKEYKDAQKDIDSATEVLGTNPDLLSNQIKIWAEHHENLNEAYSGAIMLISKNPLETRYWNSLGRIVWVNEGADEALEIVKSVTDVTKNNSDIFETLGDIYTELGEKDKAVEAYQTAIEISSDGLSVTPILKKKIRKLK